MEMLKGNMVEEGRGDGEVVEDWGMEVRMFSGSVAIAAKEAGKHYFPPLYIRKGQFARRGKAGVSTWQRRLEGCGGRVQSEMENDCASFSTEWIVGIASNG